jgi:hypothetical protein
MQSPTMPYVATQGLGKLVNVEIAAANRGIVGTTTTDWAPGGRCYNSAISASNPKSTASILAARRPTALMVFSVMLGTNDSASAGSNNAGIAGLNAGQYKLKMKAIIDQILIDWPAAKIFVHMSPWYSPNFRNSSTYLQEGLSRLFSYRSGIVDLIAEFAVSKPNCVFLGDTQAFNYFEKNHLSEQQAEQGKDGVFYCHPNAVGAASLGEFHAKALSIGLLPLAQNSKDG